MIQYKFILLYLFVINVLKLLVYTDANKSVEVELPFGILRGVQRLNFYAFEGIPYAEAPIGENRFEEPKIYTGTWDGVRNADAPGSNCIQYDLLIFDDNKDNKVHGSEDCLYLNIYTRNLNPKQKYPVLFHIHGGAYLFGWGDLYGPDYLLQREMIYVSFNYRLGPLGFLSMQDEHLPGNYGLKDQNIALKWVRDNIHHFGGDPNKITLNGFSAGAASVHLHYLSPLSRGLFLNGISHSGTGLNYWSLNEKPKPFAEQLSTFVNCPIDNSKIMKDCLKTKTAFEIVRSVGSFQKWLHNPMMFFNPVVEPESPTAFLTKRPIDSIKSGDIAPVPWLSSFCRDEGLYPAVEYIMRDELLPELNDRWLELAPLVIYFFDSVPEDKWDNVSNAIKSYYFPEGEISRDTFKNVVKMQTQRLFTSGHQKALKLHSQNTKSPVYFYFYEFHAEFGFEQFLPNNTKDLGVAHGDDIFLIFSTPFRTGPTKLNTNEIVMQHRLLDLYESFMANKKPIFGGARIDRTKVDNNGKYNHFLIKSPTKYGATQSKDIGNEKFWDSILPMNTGNGNFIKGEF